MSFSLLYRFRNLYTHFSLPVYLLNVLVEPLMPVSSFFRLMLLLVVFFSCSVSAVWLFPVSPALLLGGLVNFSGFWAVPVRCCWCYSSFMFSRPFIVLVCFFFRVSLVFPVSLFYFVFLTVVGAPPSPLHPVGIRCSSTVFSLSLGVYKIK